MKNHIDMTVTNEGLRIELTESEKGTFFDSGSAKISGDGAELLKTLPEGKSRDTRRRQETRMNNDSRCTTVKHQKRCSFLWRSLFEVGVLPQAPC